VCRRFPDAPLFTLLFARGRLSPAIERMDIHTSFLNRLPGAQRHYRLLLPWMPRAIERLRLPAEVDLVLSFSHAVAKGVRVPDGVPHVCYCFTPMRYAWQQREAYFAGEEQRSGWRRAVFRIGRSPLRWARNVVLDRVREWDRRSSERVTHFVAISRTVAERIRECYGRESVVIYPPVDTTFFHPADVPRDDYYLCASALVPYKRIDLAIAACKQLGRRLVIVGEGPLRTRWAANADSAVSFLGRLSDHDLREHYRRCRALLFPGEEDFGIVPVEAQACGTPVIAYGRGGATETVLAPTDDSPGAGLFFEQPTAASLAEAIQRFESRPESFCSALARRQAEKFDQTRYEQGLLEYIASVMAS
jgi:glycosyltransferase involved in cell wall biosynthesis